MLRTTTKAAKQNIMAYIRENSIDYLTECGYITESANDTDICKAIMETFKSEYGLQYESSFNENSRYAMYDCIYSLNEYIRTK